MNANNVKVPLVWAASCVALIAALSGLAAHAAGPIEAGPIIEVPRLDPGLTSPPQLDTPPPQLDTPPPQLDTPLPQLDPGPSINSGPPPGGGDGPSYTNLVLPAVCAGLDADEINDACNIVSAVKLGWQLREAIGSAQYFREITELLLQATGPNIVGYAFPTSANLSYKIDLVNVISDNQVALFQAIQNGIQINMIDNPISQAARRAGAIASSYNYVLLTQQAAAEARQSAAKTANYLQESPNTSRVRFHCSNSCGQLIHIYRTGVGFD
jgi:hypothetical protein